MPLALSFHCNFSNRSLLWAATLWAVWKRSELARNGSKGTSHGSMHYDACRVLPLVPLAGFWCRTCVCSKFLRPPPYPFWQIKFDSVGVTHLARVSAIACCPASAVESYTCAECAADGSFQNVTIVATNYSGGLQAVVLVSVPAKQKNETSHPLEFPKWLY